eukprot:3081695-Amphidinium_carterae.4
MRQHMKELGKMDPYMTIDECLVAHLAGPDGADELKERWVAKCLPNDGVYVTIQAAQAASDAIVKSPIFQWAPASVQNELKVASEMLVCVAVGQSLPLAKSNTNFTSLVWGRLIWFITDAAPAKPDESAKLLTVGDTMLVHGTAAFEQKWEKLDKAATPKTDELYAFITFRHLLAEKDQTILDGLVKSSFAEGSKKRKTTPAVKAAAKASSKKPKLADADALSRVTSLADAYLFGE